MASERDLRELTNLRMLGERMVVEALLRDLIERCDAPAFRISVDDGSGSGDLVVKESRCVRQIMEAVFAVDESRLIVEWPSADGEGDGEWGYVWIVLGNDASEVLSDYHVGLERYFPSALALAAAFERDGVLATIAKDRASGDYPPSRFSESWRSLWRDIARYHPAKA